MLRLPIQLVRHRRVTTLLFRSPGETDGYALLIAFNATLFAPVSRLDATVPSTGKWVVREASCLPKININSKWIALLPILTPRLRNSEQAFRVRRLALRIIDSIWVVLNKRRVPVGDGTRTLRPIRLPPVTIIGSIADWARCISSALNAELAPRCPRIRRQTMLQLSRPILTP